MVFEIPGSITETTLPEYTEPTISHENVKMELENYRLAVGGIRTALAAYKKENEPIPEPPKPKPVFVNVHNGKTGIWTPLPLLMDNLRVMLELYKTEQGVTK
jgi:hypothetical protein